MKKYQVSFLFTEPFNNEHEVQSAMMAGLTGFKTEICEFEQHSYVFFFK